jgi:phage-related protein
MSDFYWVPNTNTQAHRTYRVLETQMGDGYKQASADGINPQNEEWTLVFDPIPSATYGAIIAFLDGKGGWQSFTWTPLTTSGDNAELRVRCKDVLKDIDAGDYRKLTVIFERTYIP